MSEDVKTWRCFLCDEVFVVEAEARDHFSDGHERPGCVDPLSKDEKARLKELRDARELARRALSDAEVAKSAARASSDQIAQLKVERDRMEAQRDAAEEKVEQARQARTQELSEARTRMHQAEDRFSRLGMLLGERVLGRERAAEVLRVAEVLRPDAGVDSCAQCGRMVRCPGPYVCATCAPLDWLPAAERELNEVRTKLVNRTLYNALGGPPTLTTHAEQVDRAANAEAATREAVAALRKCRRELRAFGADVNSIVISAVDAVLAKHPEET